MAVLAYGTTRLALSEPATDEVDRANPPSSYGTIRLFLCEPATDKACHAPFVDFG